MVLSFGYRFVANRWILKTGNFQRSSTKLAALGGFQIQGNSRFSRYGKLLEANSLKLVGGIFPGKEFPFRDAVSFCGWQLRANLVLKTNSNFGARRKLTGASSVIRRRKIVITCSLNVITPITSWKI